MLKKRVRASVTQMRCRTERHWLSQALVGATKAITQIARIVVGLTFVLSGVIKCIDPAGMGYKIQAYLSAWGLMLERESTILLVSAIGLGTLEFVVGIHILHGMRSRLATSIACLFMTVMTGLTIYIYAYNPVPDCGCFGEAITLTNTQTLQKNILLLTLAILLVLRSGDIRKWRLISERNQWLTSLYSHIFIIVLGIYSMRYLPIVDFTPYKVGTNMRTAIEGEYKTTFTYSKDGSKEVFDEGNLPDSTWTFVESKTETIKAPTIADFALFDGDEDYTTQILSDAGYVFLLTLPNISSADAGSMDRINDIYDFCADNGYAMFAVTEDDSVAIREWKDLTGAAYPFLQQNTETTRAMVRANPGIMLIHDGVIIAKWSNNDLPKEAQLQEITQQHEHETLQAQDNTMRDDITAAILWYIIPLLVLIFLDRAWVAYKIFRNKTYNNSLTQNTTMRKKIVAGNWKMNKNLQEGVALATELKDTLKAEAPNCEVIIGTPFIHLATVSELLKDSVIAVSAENCADHTSGAYTGEVSAEMVKSTGAEYVILGHSERREYYAETPEILKTKVDLALAAGLKVIFCIGESLAEREANKQEEVCKAELEGSVFHLSAEEWKNIVIAYEPIWAIGTGKTATAEQAEEIHAYIRKCVAEKYGEAAADETSILYGGSCKASNAPELFAKPDIDGGLIGGASLKAPDFKGIIDAWK